MKRVLVILVSTVSMFHASSVQAAVPWADIWRGIVGGAVGQAAENMVNGRPVREGLGGAAVGGAITNVIEAIGRAEGGITDLSMRNALVEFRAALDERVTHQQLDAMWRDIDQRLTSYETRVYELERQHRLLSENVAVNRDHIRNVERELERHKAEFERTVSDIRIKMQGIRNDLEGLRAEFETEKVHNALVDSSQSKRIRQLERVLLPETSGTIAAKLGAKGAELIVNNGDPEEAAKLLLLSIAYDARANEHADPGAQYYLAVAYRRMNESNLARRSLMNAVFAERFRRVPPWFVQTSQWFQGPDRLWMNETRRDPRLGVRAPRVVSTLAPYRIPVPSP